MLATLSTIQSTLLILLSLTETLQDILFAVLAVLNGILAVIATLAIWKSYLLTGAKIALTALVVVPIVGIIAYLIWGRKKVDKSS